MKTRTVRLIELLGAGMAVSGLWLIEPAVALVAGGLLVVFLAQGAEGR